MPRFAAAFAGTEFRALWAVRALSLVGDQLARVALAVLVFRRTGSPALTGLVYGLSFLPYLAGPLFAGIADRRPRRAVMVTLDLLRAGLVALMALPGMPLAAMCVLLVAVTAVSPLYDAARAATIPAVLTPDVYPTGLAVMTMTTEGAQVLGFACGGAIVAAFGTHTALAADAFTFALSALLVARFVARRRAPMPPAGASLRGQLAAASRLVFGSPRLRALLALAWLNALWLVPEALAAPYAARLHAGAVAVGLLLSAIPFGCVVGAAALGRFVEHERRLRLMSPLGLLAAAPLVGCLAHPGLVPSLALWALCGVGTAYNVPANAAFVAALPDARRGQAFALVTTGIVTGQGLAALAAGGAATIVSPATVVAAAGVLGLLAVGVLAATWLRMPRIVALPGPIDLTATEQPAQVPAG